MSVCDHLTPVRTLHCPPMARFTTLKYGKVSVNYKWSCPALVGIEGRGKARNFHYSPLSGLTSKGCPWVLPLGQCPPPSWRARASCGSGAPSLRQVWFDGWSECWRLCCVLLMLLDSRGSSEARVYLSLPDYLARLWPRNGTLFLLSCV